MKLITPSSLVAPAVHDEHGPELILVLFVLLALCTDGGEAQRAAQQRVGPLAAPQLGHPGCVAVVGLGVVKLWRGTLACLLGAVVAIP